MFITLFNYLLGHSTLSSILGVALYMAIYAFVFFNVTDPTVNSIIAKTLIVIAILDIVIENFISFYEDSYSECYDHVKKPSKEYKEPSEPKVIKKSKVVDTKEELEPLKGTELVNDKENIDTVEETDDESEEDSNASDESDEDDDDDDDSVHKILD
jgi:hypothetical protein